MLVAEQVKRLSRVYAFGTQAYCYTIGLEVIYSRTLLELSQLAVFLLGRRDVLVAHSLAHYLKFLSFAEKW